MHGGVEDADHLPVHLDAVGDEDRLRERPPDRLADRTFAVAGGAVNQERLPGVDRGAEAADHARGEHQVGEGRSEPLHRDLLVGKALAQHLLLVLRQRDRQRPHVFALMSRFDGKVPGRRREGVAGDARVGPLEPLDFDKPLLLELAQQVVDDPLPQPELGGDRHVGLEPQQVHAPEQEPADELHVEPGLLELCGHGGEKIIGDRVHGLLVRKQFPILIGRAGGAITGKSTRPSRDRPTISLDRAR